EAMKILELTRSGVVVNYPFLLMKKIKSRVVVNAEKVELLRKIRMGEPVGGKHEAGTAGFLAETARNDVKGNGSVKSRSLATAARDDGGAHDAAAAGRVVVESWRMGRGGKAVHSVREIETGPKPSGIEYLRRCWIDHDADDVWIPMEQAAVL